MLCVSDARTEREVGRYDRTTGLLTVNDVAPGGGRERMAVYEIVRALWSFLSGDAQDAVLGDEPAQPDPVPEADDESETDDVPGSDDAPEAAGLPEAVEAAAVVPEAAEPAAVVPAIAEPALVVPRSRGASGRAGRIVDRRLSLLRRDGWAVLSRVAHSCGADIDRLVIGPPGVFAITVRRGDELPGQLRNGLRDNRRDAEFASRMLSERCGLPVRVRPIVAYVGPAALDAAEISAAVRDSTTAAAAATAAIEPPSPPEVLVARAEEIVEILRDLSSVHSLDERYRIVDAARGASSWGPIAA